LLQNSVGNLEQSRESLNCDRNQNAVAPLNPIAQRSQRCTRWERDRDTGLKWEDSEAFRLDLTSWDFKFRQRFENCLFNLLELLLGFA
jgi:hypothetical protein